VCSPSFFKGVVSSVSKLTGLVNGRREFEPHRLPNNPSDEVDNRTNTVHQSFSTNLAP